MQLSMNPRGPQREHPCRAEAAGLREARAFPARAGFATMGLTARPERKVVPVTAQYPALSVADIDLSDTEFWGWPLADRRAAFAVLRAAEHPPFFAEPETPFAEPGPGYYALVRHADVVEASRRPEVFSSGRGATSIPDLPAEFNEYFGSMINIDDPRHARLRRIVSRAFTPRMIKKFEGDVLVVAGNETTRNALSHSLTLLTDFPDQRELLMADFDGRIGAAVEELVRYSSPVIFMRRTVTRDHRMNGHDYHEGDKAVLYYWSANQDETVFADPARLDLTRSPNPHVGFGAAGPHFCLGAHLARREVGVMLRELLTRVPDICAAGPPDRLLSSFINGVKHLPCTFGG